MKKGIANALALLLVFLLLVTMTACGSETVEEPETEEPALLQAEGTLVSYEKGELTLQTEDGELSFLTDAETSFSLARGFIAGDVFVVSYEEGDEAASSVTSTVNDELEPYTLRGTVRAECGEELTRCGISGEWSAVLIDGRDYYVATELLLTERPGKLSTIEYDANGGMAAPETQHKLSGEQLVLSQLVPVRKGWHFVHWNTHEKGYGMIFEPGAVYALDGDITLYAQWEEGEPEPETEEPAVSEEMTAESAEETTEETTEEEAEPVRDSSSAIAGTLVFLEDGRLCLQAAGLEYEFDVSAATLTAESGVHPGDLVTVRYAGTLGAERDSTAAPAVRVTVTTGEPEESGKLTAVGADLAAISTGKTELFAAVEAPEAEVGESVTLYLSAADGNLFTATVK